VTRDDARAATRERYAARIEAVGGRSAKAYAAFVRAGDPREPRPCWGGIIERFLATFPSDDERLPMLAPILELGDRRAALLIIATSRAHPRLLEALCTQAGALPVDAQRALVATREAAAYVAEHIDVFCDDARALFEGSDRRRRAELEQLDSRVATLTALPYFVPDAVDPANEPRADAARAPEEPR
jgi:hypothetical protein